MPILADHKTHEQLTDHEHEVLSGLLTLLRDKTQWVPELLDALADHAEGLERGIPLTEHLVLGEVIGAYVNEPTNLRSLSGVLMAIGEKGDYEEIGAEDFRELSTYLKVKRAGGWLAQRIWMECDWFVKGNRYTPGEVIQHIADWDFESFQSEIAISKDLIRDYPRLFEDDLKALGAAVTNVDPVEPAASEAEPVPSAPKPIVPQRRPRKQSSRKAAAHVASK